MVDAAYVSLKKEISLPYAVSRMGLAVREWCERTRFLGFEKLIIELPQTYGGRAARGDANDLIILGAVAGAIQSGIDRPTIYVRPREWKGQAPKEVIQARLEQALTPKELKIIRQCGARPSLMHNVWDAVGIGHFYWTKLHGKQKAA